MRAADQQEQLIRRLRSEAERASRLDHPVAGRFLSAEERSLALRAARDAGLTASFDGGWSDAERVQVCFHSPLDEPEFTARWVQITWNARFAHPEHRDLFGSLMGLGIDRSYFGDLLAMDNHALLYTLPETSVRLPSEWAQAGRTTIKVEELAEPPIIQAPEGQLMHDTVASMRLDSVLSSGIRASRTKAAEMIRQGLVQIDHIPEERVDRMLEAGQLISVRGFGRIRIREVGDPTRKDRLPIELELFTSGR